MFVLMLAAVVFEVHPVVSGLEFLFRRGLVFDALNPACGCRHFVKVKHSCADKSVKVDSGIVAFYDFGARLDSPDDLPDSGKFLRLNFGCLVEQDDVAELYLPDNEILYVLLTDVPAGEAVSAAELAFHAQGIYNGHDAVEAADAVFAVCLSESRDGADGLGYRLRLADAAGFYDDIVEALHLHEFIYLLHKVGLEGAADAAVLQGHQTVVLASDDSSLLNKVRVNVDFSYIIDYYGKPYSFPVGKNVVDKGCLSASEITGQKQDRNCLVFHRVISLFPGFVSALVRGIKF